MIRYELHDDGFDNCYMKASETGEYILFADHDAENARLRDALEQIFDEWESYDRGGSDYSQGYENALNMVANIAHAALWEE
jgi:hypothetical protein